MWRVAWFWRTCICLISIRKEYVTSHYPHCHWYVRRRRGAWFGRVCGHVTSHYPHCHWYIRQRHVIWHVAWFWRMSDHVTCNSGSGDNVTYYPPVEIRRNWATFSGRKDSMLCQSGNYVLKPVISLLALHGWIHRLIAPMYPNFPVTRMLNNRYEIRKKFVSLEKYVNVYLNVYIDRF